MPPSTTELIERAEIDSQISTAKKYPRSLEMFKKRAIGMAIIDEETAESCLYRRPVGKKGNETEYAEGMSVRMAEIVGACYGNLRVAATLVEQTERFVRARGMAIDLESNFAGSSEVIESTVDKNGKPFSERMRVVVAKAALAKARRDATFQVVPRALAKPVEAEVRKLLLGDTQTLGRRRAAVLSWIGKLGIDPKRVWLSLGIGGEADLGVEQLEALTGVRTAIKDGEASIDEAFPDPKLAGPKVGLGELVGAKKSEATKAPPPPTAADDPPPNPVVKETAYTAQQRDAFIKEIEDLMLTHGITESRVMKLIRETGRHVEGQDEVSTLSTAVLDALRNEIPNLKNAKK